MGQIENIIWAIDPHEAHLAPDAQTLAELQELTLRHGVVIEPVYVHASETETDNTASRDLTAAIRTLLKTYAVTTLTPRILMRSPRSLKNKAACLVEYAEQTRARTILVTSRGPHDLTTLLLGSFVEALLKLTTTPILVLNKEPRPPGAEFRHVLWTTDFSRVGESAFAHFLKDARAFCSNLTLYHELPKAPERDQLERASAWRQSAENAGLHAHVQLEVKDKPIQRESLIKTAEQNNCGLIAMVSQTGPVGSLFFGSHTRDLIQDSRFPILIYGGRAALSEPLAATDYLWTQPSM